MIAARSSARRLTATQPRAFARDGRLLSHPADVLAFLVEGAPSPTVRAGRRTRHGQRERLIVPFALGSACSDMTRSH